MNISEEDARQEFKGDTVQLALHDVEESMEQCLRDVELINWGGQGLIIRAACDSSGGRLCVKLPHPNDSETASAKHAILKEALINKALTENDADFVPKYLGHSQDGSWLVREYAEGEVLHEVIRNAGIEERIGLAYLEWKMISKAFVWLHDNRWQSYVIRDLKAKNLILSWNRTQIMLIDLGSCRREDNMTSRRKKNMMRRFGGGEFQHWPLEQLLENSEKCSRKVDYFAAGVLVYETVFNDRPYSNLEKDPLHAWKKYKEEYLSAEKRINEAVSNQLLPSDLAEMMKNALLPDSDDRSFRSWK